MYKGIFVVMDAMANEKQELLALQKVFTRENVRFCGLIEMEVRHRRSERQTDESVLQQARRVVMTYMQGFCLTLRG